MSAPHASTPYALVETEIGWIGIAWSPAGVVRLQLPDRDRARTTDRLTRSLENPVETPPTGPMADLADQLRANAAGDPVDFSGVAVDLSAGDDFRRSIWAAARGLRHGETTTYGGLAVDAGHKGLARETGEALGRNPVPIIVPCHRILAAGGKIGGFSAPGGAATKRRLLALEGVATEPLPPVQRSFGF